MSSMASRKNVTGPVWLDHLGFEGDEVADPVNHGGEDKAVHHYFFDHYPWWKQQLGSHPLLENPGAFGENISTRGMIESELRIGDRFRMGEALVEISHGRQPCWKLDHNFGVSGKESVMATIVRTGRCGIYYRVIEPGNVAAGNMIRLIERGPARWTVDRVFKLLIGGGYKQEPEALEELAELPQLAKKWRLRAESLLG